MAKLFGNALAESIEREKQDLINAMERRRERINNWETDDDDCFLSDRVESNAINECNMQLEILKGDGMMDYEAVFDQEGNEIYVHLANTRYGVKYVGRGIFASSMKALLKKTGWEQKTIRVPAWTKFCPCGSGLCGVYSGSYQVVRWHTNMVTGEYVGF